jgi:lipopolysaccharide export system protein LptC
MIRWVGILFILFVGLSVWMLFKNQITSPQPAPAAVLEGYMVEAHYTQYDNQGQIHMVMHTPKMTHYEQESTSYFEKPEILTYTQKRIPWTINAEKGVAIHDSEQVNLTGNVVIHQAPQPGYPETTITTTEMTIFPHRSYAETHQPVLIIRPDSRIEAVGMQADFKTGLFTLLTSVKGSYVPHQNTP